MRPNPHATDVWRAIVDPHDSDADSDVTSDGKQLIAREHQRQPWCRLRLKLACTVFWAALILSAVTWVLLHSSERTYYASAPPAGAVNYTQLLRAVERLPYTLPTKANQLAAVAAGQPQREEAIARMAAGTAPFLHARTWRLASRFLELKQRVGSAVERREYAGMETAAFVTRLLSRRPLVFMDARDIYLTQTGEQGEGKELFLKIGSSKEAPPLTLSRYLS